MPWIVNPGSCALSCEPWLVYPGSCALSCDPWLVSPGEQGSGMRLKLRLDHGCFFSSSLFRGAMEAGALQRGLARALTGLTLSHCSQPVSASQLEVPARMCLL